MLCVGTDDGQQEQRGCVQSFLQYGTAAVLSGRDPESEPQSVENVKHWYLLAYTTILVLFCRKSLFYYYLGHVYETTENITKGF